MKKLGIFIFALVSLNSYSQKLTYKDVGEQELNQVYSDFEIGVTNSEPVWVRAVNRWANKRGFNGYPNFEIGKNRVRGIQLLKEATYIDISQTELNDVLPEFKLNSENDPIVWHRAINRWANKRGLAGIPTFEIGKEYVRGAIMVKDFVYFDVTEEELNSVEPKFIIGETNSYEIWARASNRLANKKGYYFGFSNFEIGKDRVRGIHCVQKIPNNSDAIDECNRVIYSSCINRAGYRVNGRRRLCSEYCLNQ